MSELLILHGVLGSAGQFTALQQSLRVHTTTFEFYGHGEQPDVAADWTIELFATQLEKYLDSQPRPLPIFGYSMGGYVALWLSLRRPDLVPKLLTLGTKFAWTREGALADSSGLLHQKTIALMVQLGHNPLLTADAVKEVKIPVRYMVGDRDRMVSIEETLNIYRNTPSAEFAVLPNTKHAIEKVDRNILVHQITTFFNLV